jgi:DNA-directed RNA polymerase subunit RPC12/RpoP
MVSIETPVGRVSSLLAPEGRCEAFRSESPESLVRSQCVGIASWRWDRPVSGTVYYCDACARDAFPEIAEAEGEEAAEVRCRYCGRPDDSGSGVCDACTRKLDADGEGRAK